MLRPFFPELVMSTDLLSFKHPSVLLFCYYTQHSILVPNSQHIHHRWIILAGNIYFDKISHSNRVKVIIKVKVKFSDDLIASRKRFYDKIDFNLSVLSYMNTDLYVSICHLNRQFMHSFSGYITKKVWY